MTLTTERARALLRPSVPADESLNQVAAAAFAGSTLKYLLMIFGPAFALIAVLVAAKINTRSPAAIAGVTVGMLALVVGGVVAAKRSTRYAVVGVTGHRLLVAVLAGRTADAVAEVWDYPFDKLKKLGFKQKMVMAGTGKMISWGRFTVADPDHPFRIDFVPGLIPGNDDAYREIRDAVIGQQPAA